MKPHVLMLLAGIWAGAYVRALDPVIRLETPRGGVFMPQVALGTWEYSADQVGLAIPYGLAQGFTHIDTANNYRNQRAVGAAIRASGTHRESIFITTKIPGCNLTTPQACELQTASDIDDDLEQLGFRNVDLMLLHFPPRPFPWRPEADCARLRAQWRALEAAYEAGKARAIGVSNFCPSCFECLQQKAAIVGGEPSAADPPARIVPAVNQVRKRCLYLRCLPPVARSRTQCAVLRPSNVALPGPPAIARPPRHRCSSTSAWARIRVASPATARRAALYCRPTRLWETAALAS